jgi:hypothetical protein
LIIVFATEFTVGATVFVGYVLVKHPENLMNKFLSCGMDWLSAETALIVNSQNYIALLSLSERAS